MMQIRKAYGEALVRFAEDYDYYVMDADVANATMSCIFRDAYPDRFIDMGIAEDNMFGYAAGISLCGMPVFASAFAPFSAGRAYDQIRNSIMYPGCNVKVVVTHGGIQAGMDGGSHQCVEDIALMRAIPKSVVLCPADERETFACVKAAIEHQGPVVLRIGRSDGGTLHDSDVDVKIGRGFLLRDGADVAVIAAGTVVNAALQAAKTLAAQGIDVAVVSMTSLKPLDEELVLACAEKTNCIVTFEDHNVIGGLGGAVCELLSEKRPTPVTRHGVMDRFGCSGTEAELAVKFGLDEAGITGAILKAYRNKKR